MNFSIPRKQPPARSQQKKTLHKFLVARSDIGAALETCKLFKSTVTSFKDDLYYPLFAAIVVCYARPFTNNEPYGALPKKWGAFDNPGMQDTHNRILRARHELIAHSDWAVRQTMVVPPGVVFGKSGDKELKSSRIGTQTNYYLYPIEFTDQMQETALNLGRRLNAEVESLVSDLYDGMELPNCSFNLRIDDGL